MKTFGAVLGGLAAIALVVGLCIGGYQLYWHVAKSNVSHQYDVNTGTQQYQAGLIASAEDLANGYQASQDPAQKQFIANQFCRKIKDINPVPNDLQDDAVLMNCR